MNEAYDEIDIYSGTEMDILPDGTMDYPDEVLAQLDYVIASIHQSFGQTEEEIMHRLASACRNPYVRHIAHPTRRIIGRRDGYKVNLQQLFDLARETGTILEINANPQRLDLSAEVLRPVHDIMVTINTDAHHIENLELMKYGVATAQKAFINKERVLNTMSRKDFKSFIEIIKNYRNRGMT